MAIWPTTIDDDGSSETGTGLDDAFFDQIKAYIDAAVAALVPMPWTAYTPTWASFGTQPAIGNGTIKATYSTQGSMTFFEIEIKMGSTTTYGTSDWYFTVPAGRPIVSPDGNRACVIAAGRAYSLAQGRGYGIAGGVMINAGSFVVLAPTNHLSSAVPFTWASGDSMLISGAYRSG